MDIYEQFERLSNLDYYPGDYVISVLGIKREKMMRSDRKLLVRIKELRELFLQTFFTGLPDIAFLDVE